MKRNKTALRILVTLAVVMAISFWVGTSSKEVQAAEIGQPTPINEIFTDENLANAIKTTLSKPSTASAVSQVELDSVRDAVPFTHPTLPTIHSVYISVVAASIK